MKDGIKTKLYQVEEEIEQYQEGKIRATYVVDVEEKTVAIMVWDRALMEEER